MKIIKAKKIISVITLFAAVLTISACSPRFSGEERFAARANVTISVRIGDYPELADVVEYTFTTIEYYEDSGARVIRADCSARKIREDGSEEFSRHVFLLSDKLDYLENFPTGVSVDIFHDEFRELFYMNLGDFAFTPNENNFVSKENINRITASYFEALKNNDADSGEIIGME